MSVEMNSSTVWPTRALKNGLARIISDGVDPLPIAPVLARVLSSMPP